MNIKSFIKVITAEQVRCLCSLLERIEEEDEWRSCNNDGSIAAFVCKGVLPDGESLPLFVRALAAISRLEVENVFEADGKILTTTHGAVVPMGTVVDKVTQEVESSFYLINGEICRDWRSEDSLLRARRRSDDQVAMNNISPIIRRLDCWAERACMQVSDLLAGVLAERALTKSDPMDYIAHVMALAAKKVNQQTK